MKREIKECDRCGGEIRRGGRHLKVTEPDPETQFDKDERDLDLCPKCWDDFETWLKNKASRFLGVPRGYKKVPRPCPHHVPCAAPWGCSGTEIVPLSDPREPVPQGF